MRALIFFSFPFDSRVSVIFFCLSLDVVRVMFFSQQPSTVLCMRQAQLATRQLVMAKNAAFNENDSQPLIRVNIYHK